MKMNIMTIVIATVLCSCINSHKTIENKFKPNTVIFIDKKNNSLDSVDLYSFKKRCYIDTIVPDKYTAIKIGFIVLSNIYGENNIRHEFPLSITLDHDQCWTISGTLPKESIGGTAYIRINRLDGKIIEVFHFK